MPTIENITENNHLIAEFERLKIIGKDAFNMLGENAYLGENKGVVWGIIEYLDYHSNWNSLMRVLEKIEGSHPATYLIIAKQFTIINAYDVSTNTSEIIKGEGNSKLEASYNAAIEFINWYNQNNNHEHHPTHP